MNTAAAPDSPAIVAPPTFWGVMRRIPATLTLLVVLLAIGLVTGTLWSAAEHAPWFENVAYGLPAFEAGRWWTPITGTFFVAKPWVFVPTILAMVGLGFLEFMQGTARAMLYFGVGQLFAIFASAAFLAIGRLIHWPWAMAEAQMLDVGPSGGTMAALAAAAGLLVAPWRQRAWLVMLTYALVSLLFLGQIADIEHAFAIGLVLAVDRSFRIRKTTVREQRLLAEFAVYGIGAMQLITYLVPTYGPFGPTTPLTGSWIDAAIDAVLLILLGAGLRRGRVWAWRVSMVLTSLNIIVAVVFFGFARFWPEFHAMVEAAVGDTDARLAASVLWAVLFGYLIATRAAFKVRRRTSIGDGEASRVDQVRQLIRTSGADTLSWMTTWEGMNYFRTSTGIVPFQQQLGVAIVLADPLGPPDGIATSAREFIAAAENAALTPCFFSASQPTHDAMPSGWRSLIVADDTIVDLPGLEFTGKAWQPVRGSFNRGERDGMTFRMTRLIDEPWGVVQQLRAISEMWVGDKGLPEMRFTLGTLVEAKDPEVRLALAISPQGDVDGFLSWLPVYGPGGVHRGWTLDLMRRREGGFGPVMEYLIGSSAKLFSEEGAQILSLSGAPLTHETEPEDGVIAQLMSRLADSLEPVYGFKSLHSFKRKFNPRYEPIYLLYRDEGDLARIAAALTRAFLPDATLRQFASAGVELVRPAAD